MTILFLSLISANALFIGSFAGQIGAVNSTIYVFAIVYTVFSSIILAAGLQKAFLWESGAVVKWERKKKV